MVGYSMIYAVMFVIALTMTFLWGMHKDDGEPVVYFMMALSAACAGISLMALIFSLQ